jgi:hypothetical protein
MHEPQNPAIRLHTRARAASADARTHDANQLGKMQQVDVEKLSSRIANCALGHMQTHALAPASSRSPEISPGLFLSSRAKPSLSFVAIVNDAHQKLRL